MQPRPRNSEYLLRGRPAVSAGSAGYQISVWSRRGPPLSGSVRAWSSSCSVVTPTANGPAGMPVTESAALLSARLAITALETIAPARFILHPIAWEQVRIVYLLEK